MIKEIRSIVLESSSLLDLEEKLAAQSIYIDERQNTVFLSTVAAQLAYEGQINRVHWLYRLGAKADGIAQGYALAGNHRQAELWYERYAVTTRILAWDDTQISHHRSDTYNACMETQSCLDSINGLLDSYLLRLKISPTLSLATLKKHPQRLFSFFTKHSDNQEVQAITVLKQALRGEHVRVIEHLCIFRCGKLGQGLRDFIKSGMANTLVQEKVSTVTEFISALNYKVWQTAPIQAAIPAL